MLHKSCLVLASVLLHLYSMVVRLRCTLIYQNSCVIPQAAPSSDLGNSGSCQAKPVNSKGERRIHCTRINFRLCCLEFAVNFATLQRLVTSGWSQQPWRPFNLTISADAGKWRRRKVVGFCASRWKIPWAKSSMGPNWRLGVARSHTASKWAAMTSKSMKNAQVQFQPSLDDKPEEGGLVSPKAHQSCAQGWVRQADAWQRTMSHNSVQSSCICRVRMTFGETDKQ